MLTNTSKWSHARGNEVVPSRWQMTANMRLAPQTLRSLKLKGTSAGVARSARSRGNSASTTTVTPKVARVRYSSQPQVGAWLKPNTAAVRPTVTGTAPGAPRFVRDSSRACAGTCFAMRVLTTIPMGALMKKFHRHPAYQVRTPHPGAGLRLRRRSHHGPVAQCTAAVMAFVEGGQHDRERGR